MVDGVVEYRLIYSDQLTPAAKVDVDGNVIEEYVYGTGVNSPDYIKKDGVNYRVIKDHLGSTRMVVNASTGDIVKTITYDEFGNTTSETGDFDILFGYAGGLRDTDTGLIKFGARDYDPETGRWTSKEPLGFEGSLNFYVYCDADPVNYVDVTGLKLDPVGTTEEKKRINYALMRLEIYSPTARNLIKELRRASPKKPVTIEMGPRSTHLDGKVVWNEFHNDITEPWEIGVPSEIWLAHELIHALHYVEDVKKPWLNHSDADYMNQPEEYFTTGLITEGNECSPYRYTENKIRKDYMKYYPNLTFRDYYYTGAIEREKRDFNPAVCY